MTSLWKTHKTGDLGISKAASKIRNWRQPCKLEIQLHDHYHSKIYSSNSTVQGNLIISPTSSFSASSIAISLDGTTKIRVIGQQITTTTTHRFLKIDLMTPEIPELISKRLEKDQVYNIPFSFTFPEELDPTICTHRVVSGSIEEAHLCLPPTVGGWDRDDMSTGAVEIEYAINACIKPSSAPPTENSQDITAKRVLRFIPKSTESPPLHVSLTSKRYTLQATKCLRRKSFKRSFGTISAAAIQPEPLHLHPYGAVMAPSFIDVGLTFNPERDGTPPPQLDTVSLSVRSYTWHQADPYKGFPDLSEKPSLKEPMSTVIPLRVECPDMTWVKHVIPSLENTKQRDLSPAFYSSTLRLPVSLSMNDNTFLPTFHSCLVSRTYDVRLRLTFEKGDLTIVTPLQIIAES
ncbi:hypothetical protein F53441_11388 [Fusarium austroafricanum]|uniref:Bul1 C-terminal domain-containing protein n=1 Tax=Fusarium austroafricanum TaxID=2364996 RepID=A0A8H4K4P8_9HYPO|nr:hypothetical protein F53441_11388 [Fusarium austroafricanum]